MRIAVPFFPARWRAIGTGVVALAWLVAPLCADTALAAATADPGFPYVDANCDRRFDPADGDAGRTTGVDLLAIVLSGRPFDTSRPVDDYVPAATPACLVWPRSVHLRSHTSLTLDLHAGADLVFLGAAKLANGGIALTADERLEADRASLQASGDLALGAGVDETSDGMLSASRAKLTSTGGAISLFATKAINVAASDVRALDTVELDDDNDAPGGIDAQGARLRSVTGDVQIYADFAYDPAVEAPAVDVSVRLDGAKIGAAGDIEVVTLGGAILAERARIQGTPDSDVKLDSAGGLIGMDRVRIARADDIDVWTWVEPGNPTERAFVLADGARLNNEGNVFFNVGGCGGGEPPGPAEIHAPDLSILTVGGATLRTKSHTAPGFIDVSGARLMVTGGFPSDLLLQIVDTHDSTIDARGVQVLDPILPTFLAEHVLGDPTQNSPDLAFPADGLVLTERSDTELEADWRIVDYGPREVGPRVEVAFFWSDDAKADAADTELGRTMVPTAMAGRGGEATGSLALTVPAGETKYVVAVVDPANAVRELNEENNQFPARRPTIDLRFDGQFGLRIFMTSATEAVVNWTLRNGSDRLAPAGIEIDFHLSMDAVLDASDTFLATRTLADPLPGFTNQNGSESFAGLPPEGVFFVIATIDPRNAVVEAEEGNNQRSLGVGPNLTVGFLDARYRASDQTLEVQTRIDNHGQRPAVGPIELHYTLRPVAGSERVLGTATIPDVDANSSHGTTVEFFVPLAEATGTMTVHADAADAVAEFNEIDNRLTAPIHHVP